MPSELQPYVGPRPFEREEHQRFFGREREASELLSRVIAHPAVLLYSQSGAGKTSLLNASLIPLLEKEGFEILPTARVRGLAPKDIPAEDIPNLYVFNVLVSWTGGTADPQSLAKMTIADFLNLEDRPIGREGMPAPRVAVFDQFEELFTFYPERWNERQNFFEQVSEALERDRLMRIIFVMREDYIAELDPYVSALPEKLRTRFRLERLREDAALEAVKEPLDGTGYSYAGGVAEQLVNNLLEVPVETAAGVSTVVGEFVEPVQLQVVCQTLWQKLDHSESKEITLDQLKAFGDVDLALSHFYETAIVTVSRDTGVNEGHLRRWFEHTLITPSGTRGTVFRGRQETGGIPNAAVDKLVDQHLIRGELRGGAHWYELTHDRLIEPIITSNQQWMLQRSGAEQTRQRLEKRAAEWVRSGRPNSGLLDEAELLEARRWLESPNANDVGYSEALFALVQASRAAVEAAALERERLLFAEQQRRAEAEHALVEDQQRHIEEQKKASRRLRRLAAALAVMFLLAIGTAVYAVNQSRAAKAQTQLAREKEQEALGNLQLARRETARANTEAANASRQAGIAGKQTELAIDEKTRAETLGKQAEAERKRAEGLAASSREDAIRAKRSEERAKNELAKSEQLELSKRRREKANDERIAASALSSSGNYSEALTRYESALEILNTPLEEFKTTEDTDDQTDIAADQASIHTDIGAMYLRRGREARQKEDKNTNFNEAIKWFQSGIALLRGSPEDNDLAVILNYLGVAFDLQEKYADAARLYEQAVTIRKRELSPDDPNLALSYSNLAGAYESLARNSEAEQLYKLAIAIREKVLQPNDPTLTENYRRLAGIYENQGRLNEAIETYKKAIASLRSAKSSRDRDISLANNLSGLGVTYYYLGKYQEAETNYKEALDLEIRARGPDHSQVGVQLHNLGLLYFVQARYDEAEQLEKRAISIYTAASADSDDVASSLTVLARVYQKLAKYADAERFYDQALRERKKAFGDDHPFVAINLHYQAQFYLEVSKPVEAEEFEKTALDIFEKNYGPTYWRASVSRSTLATLAVGQKNYAEAERLFKQALENLEKPSVLGPNHPEVANTLSGLARLYFIQDRLAEAEPLLKRSLAIREQVFGAGHPSVAETLENYAALLRKTNRETEAGQMEARAKAIRAKYPQLSPKN